MPFDRNSRYFQFDKEPILLAMSVDAPVAHRGNLATGPVVIAPRLAIGGAIR